jgi:hypothetical protein
MEDWLWGCDLQCVPCTICTKLTYTELILFLSVCPSVGIIQLQNRWKDLGQIWYGRHDIGYYNKITFYNFPQSVISRANKLMRWDQHRRYLNTITYGNRFRKIRNFRTLIFCITQNNNMAGVWNKNNWLRRDSITWSHAWECSTLPQS